MFMNPIRHCLWGWRKKKSRPSCPRTGYDTHLFGGKLVTGSLQRVSDRPQLISGMDNKGQHKTDTGGTDSGNHWNAKPTDIEAIVSAGAPLTKLLP